MSDAGDSGLPPSVPLSRQQRRARERARRKAARLVRSGAAFAMLGAGLAGGQPASAATFSVLNLGDSGAGSLRQAVLDANAAAGPDLVDFQAGLTGTITLTGGQLAITESVEIRGPGPTTLAVSGNHASRVFHLDDGSPALLDVTISGLTIEDGLAPAGGGGILATENLTLTDVVITGNVAAGPGGGIALVNEYASLEIRNSTITGNFAESGTNDGAPCPDSGSGGGRGGGIYVEALRTSATLDTVTIANNGSRYAGGGLAVTFMLTGNLTIRSSAITGNEAGILDCSGGDGGGVEMLGFASTETVLIEDTTISGNIGDGGGGAIYAAQIGDLTLRRTIISGNDSASGGGLHAYNSGVLLATTTVADNRSISRGNIWTGHGGGASLPRSRVTIQGSTISGNTADLTGGGFQANEATVTVSNSTISGNSAGEEGGGICVSATSILDGSLTIASSTISGNTAGLAGGGIYSYLQGSSGTVVTTIRNSILADSTGGNADLANDASNSFDVAFSLIEAPGAANIIDNGGNIFDQDPQLGPLQNNGGPTETHKPAALSPAVNAGDPAFAPPPATDQRSLPRLAGGRLDMGAVELQPGSLQFSLASYSIGEGGGSATITVTRTGGSDGAVSVHFATSDGTAQQPADYLAASGTLNWADGDAAPMTFQVTIVEDLLDEPNETVLLTLSLPTGSAALGTPADAVLTIADNEISVLEIPTLGDAGATLLAALTAAAGVLALRRLRMSSRKGAVVP